MIHSGAPGIRAIDVWDILRASITTPASIGEFLDKYFVLYYQKFLNVSNGGSALIPPGKIVCSAWIGGGAIAAVAKFRARYGAYDIADAFSQDNCDSKNTIQGIFPSESPADEVLTFHNDTGGVENIIVWGFEMR